MYIEKNIFAIMPDRQIKFFQKSMRKWPDLRRCATNKEKHGAYVIARYKYKSVRLRE